MMRTRPLGLVPANSLHRASEMQYLAKKKSASKDYTTTYLLFCAGDRHLQMRRMGAESFGEHYYRDRLGGC